MRLLRIVCFGVERGLGRKTQSARNDRSTLEKRKRFMAIWQFDLFIIPTTAALPVWSGDGWEIPQWPAASTLDAQQVLLDAFGRPWLMMEDWLVFGRENGTRIDLFYEEVNGLEMSLRLDSAASGPELDAVSAFAVKLDCLFFDPDTRMAFPPDRNSLAAALAKSRAAAFSKDPRAFIAGIAIS